MSGRDGTAPVYWGRFAKHHRALRSWLYILTTTAILLMGAGCGPPPGLVRWVAERNPDVLFSVPTADSVVALTIDDGPHPALTPRILEVLAEHQVHATFFLTGKNVTGNEVIVEQMVAAGHELGNHMMTNRPSILLGSKRFEANLLRTDSLLAAFGPVTWFRPASGWFNGRMLRQAERHGYRTALGSVYPNDAQNPFVCYLSGYILRNVRPGSVIILHDGGWFRKKTVTVLKRVLPELKRRGYRVVTLSQLEGAARTDSEDSNTQRRTGASGCSGAR